MKDKGTCITAEMKKDRTSSDKNKYYWMWREEKKKRHEAEGEMTIVKGIGQNSPEVKALQSRVKELEEINESHRKLNGKLQERLKEVEEDNKKLAHEIEDRVHRMRQSGM